MKICVISYDFWDYDRKIVDALLRKGIEATHIKMTAYRYPNFGARVKNAVSKTFLGKNLKKIHRQEMIMDQLKKIGVQDCILVISPETIDAAYHEKIKKFTRKYIAYLYDSLARNPAQNVLPFFDEVFSFDLNDAEKFGFKKAFNYNYLSDYRTEAQPKYDLVYVGSNDERVAELQKIAEKMGRIGKTFRFIIVDRKKHLTTDKQQHLEFRTEKIPLHELPKYYQEGKAILDLVRLGQSGLSFRIFEAMGLRRKLVTNNRAISQYDFYGNGDFLLLNDDVSNLTADFFDKENAGLAPEIYHKYSVDGWVEKIFQI